MKKKRLLPMLIATLLLLLGAGLLLVSYCLTTPSNTSTVIPDFSYQSIGITLDDCKLSVFSDDSTYIEVKGYRENDLIVYEKNGMMILSKRTLGDEKLTLGGIAKYLSEGKNVSDEKEIILHLSAVDTEKPINIALQDSSMFLSASLQYLTLHAQSCQLETNAASFSRWDAYLEDCRTKIFLSLSNQEFTRDIKTFDTSFTVNGDIRANTDFYEANEFAPVLIIESINGELSVNYNKQNN